MMILLVHVILPILVGLLMVLVVQLFNEYSHFSSVRQCRKAITDGNYEVFYECPSHLILYHTCSLNDIHKFPVIKCTNHVVVLWGSNKDIEDGYSDTNIANIDIFRVNSNGMLSPRTSPSNIYPMLWIDFYIPMVYRKFGKEVLDILAPVYKFNKL